MGQIYKSGSVQKGGVKVGVAEVGARVGVGTVTAIIPKYRMYVCPRGGCGRIVRPHPSSLHAHIDISAPYLYICVRYINQSHI